MTPIVPRGSETGSFPTSSVDISAGTSSPEPGSSASSVSDFQPFRLSLEASYLIAGDGGGFPLRAGFLARFRPAREIAFGIRLDGNFSDQLTAGFRADGIVPLSREFSLFAAAELGVRALFAQNHAIDDAERTLSGALLNMGVEAGLDIQFHPNVGLGIFARLSYAPAGALSTPSENPNNPPLGAIWGGAEFSAGLRVNFDFGNGGEWPEEEEESESSAPLTRANDAIETIEELVDEIEEAREDGTSPAPAAVTGSETAAATEPSSEDLSELREELRELRRSGEELEIQIAAATRTFHDLQNGQDVGTALRIRLDRFYDGLIARPPTLDLAAFDAYLTELHEALQENDNLQLLMRSTTEPFGAAFLGNLTEVRNRLQAFQRTLPTTPRARDGLSRAALYPLFPRLTSILAVMQDLRNRGVDTRPSSDRITLWRENLASIENRLAGLAPGLDPEVRENIQSEFARLRASFETLTGTLEANERLWLISRASHGHYQSFQAARRPEEALAALQAMLTEFEGAPAEFRSAHARGLENIRAMLVAFIERQSAHPRRSWASVREAAVRVVQWIDSAYVPPPVVAPRRRTPPPPDGPRDPSPLPPDPGSAGEVEPGE